MSGGFDRRTYARLWRREQYQAVLREKRMSSRTCPRRFGRHGVCGALLVSSSDGRGGLVVRCPACERFERGVCRYCPMPVNGAVRKARFCEAHRKTEQRAAYQRYDLNHPGLKARRAKIPRSRVKRFQARRGNGRFTPNTPENTLGIHIDICPECGRFNPSDCFERDANGFVRPAPRPTNCRECGACLSPTTPVPVKE